MTRPPEYVPGDGKKRDSLSKRNSQAFVNPAYTSARYQTFDQDKGNGGLRNAMNAAFEAGRVKKPLWVGLPGELPMYNLPREADQSRYTRG